MKEKEKEEVT